MASSWPALRLARDDLPMTPHNPRYLDVLLRSANGRRELARSAIAGALLLFPTACGSSDQAAFASSSSSIGSSSGALTDDSTSTSTSSSKSASSSSTNGSGSVFPVGGELVVSFAYEPSSNMAKRPFVAVWVEDLDGNLVDTISLWFESGKGMRWIDELRQWYSAGGTDDMSMSSATRVAGEYTVAWDGTDSNGDPVPHGEYVVYIEAAREHGPYSITSATVTVSDSGSTVAFADDGELSNASAELIA